MGFYRKTKRNRLLSFRSDLLFLIITLAACTAPAQKTSITPPALVTTSTTTSTTPASRYGTVNVEAVQSSGVSGTFMAKDNGDGSTAISVQLNQASDFNPWGIYDNGDCINGVPVNTRPVFSLPDIESGHKEETVETEAYESTPGDLIIIIYGSKPDGSQQMVACASLGAPVVGMNASTPAPTPDCASLSPTAPQLDSGTWLAFSATINSNGDIYLLNVDSVLSGQDPLIKRLTTDPAADFDPTWSPDGMQMAFRSQRDGNDEIYVMNADGTCQTNLTNDPLADWSPAWSPDGRHIAFAHFFDNNPFTDIVVINTDGSGLTRLTREHGEYPAWSPDGSRIAFASARDGNYEIYVMSADGSNQTRLTNNPAYDMSPFWSPNGTQITFDTQRDHYPPAETGIGPEFEIHRINADGSEDIQLTNNNEEDRFPSWGPNGLIAFTSNGRLISMNSDGSEQIKLLDGGMFPAWRP
jgi:Tol biopolymer transport system component